MADVSDIPALRPAMTRQEIACTQRYLAEADSYVEFGCGGSTLLAVRSPVRRIWSVESDASWIARLRLHPEIASAEAAGRLALCRVDIGATKAYGYPVLSGWLQYLWPPGMRKWPRYYNDIWRLEGPAQADLFLIDGRFRVACGLAVAQHGRPDATVLVHDFTNRPQYEELLRFYDAKDTVRHMKVLRPKPDLDPQALASALKRYRYNPE